MPIPSAAVATNTAVASTILILPGLGNSGEGHWQTYWEQMLPTARRVQQEDWDAPSRQDWVETLEAAILTTTGPVVLAAHSLGCALVAWWAQEHGHRQGQDQDSALTGKVVGALLVAPPDVERGDFPATVRGFGPMPRIALPFASIVVASENDPWNALSTSQSFAADWQSEFHNIGALGHLNAASGLGDWQQGRQWLAQLSEIKTVVLNHISS